MNLLTKVWWAQLGSPHPQVMVHWNPGQEVPKNGIENHFKYSFMLLFIRQERRPWTHIFCKCGPKLHCDPGVNVCTCIAHGLNQSEEHIDRQSSDTLWPCTAAWAVDQRAPPQSPPDAACIWTKNTTVLGLYIYQTTQTAWNMNGDTGDYLCVQKHCVSGPISLQSIPPGTPKLTYSLFFARWGTMVLL